jgi:hypothetical protein
MSDHDQRFKTLVEEFFVEFFRLFFPSWAERFDFTRIEWLKQEVFPDPPQGERRSLDVLAKLPTRQAVPGERPGQEESWVALIHVEIESPDKVAPLRPGMFEFYQYLRWKHQLPVLPIGLYLRVGLEGVGVDVYEEHFWELRPVHFEYLYVGLPALDAVQYVQGDNWLGVALSALMRIPEDRKAWLKAEAFRRLTACPENAMRRYLLCECVDAYLPLEGPQLQEFEHLLVTEPYTGVKIMAMTYVEQGRQEGRRELLQNQLEKRFGPLSASVRERLQSLSRERLIELSLAVLDAQSLRELGLED